METTFGKCIETKMIDNQHNNISTSSYDTTNNNSSSSSNAKTTNLALYSSNNQNYVMQQNYNNKMNCNNNNMNNGGFMLSNYAYESSKTNPKQIARVTPYDYCRDNMTQSVTSAAQMPIIQQPLSPDKELLSNAKVNQLKGNLMSNSLMIEKLEKLKNSSKYTHLITNNKRIDIKTVTNNNGTNSLRSNSMTAHDRKNQMNSSILPRKTLKRQPISTGGYSSDSECTKMKIDFDFENDSYTNVNKYTSNNQMIADNHNKIKQEQLTIQSIYDYFNARRMQQSNLNIQTPNNNDIDTQSCINMKTSTTKLSLPLPQQQQQQQQQYYYYQQNDYSTLMTPQRMHQNMMKHRNEQIRIDKPVNNILTPSKQNNDNDYNKVVHLHHLATPRFSKRHNFNTLQDTKDSSNKRYSNENNSSYLNWKAFNCVPGQQTAINSTMSDIENETILKPSSLSAQLNTRRQGKPHKNHDLLSIINGKDLLSTATMDNDKDDGILNEDENMESIFNECLNNNSYNPTVRYTSASTPGTPLLSSLNGSRHRNRPNTLTTETSQPIVINKNETSIEASTDTEKKSEIGSLENALVSMNEALKSLTLSAKNKRNEYEKLKQLVTALDEGDASKLSTLNISPSSSASISSSFSSSSNGKFSTSDCSNSNDDSLTKSTKMKVFNDVNNNRTLSLDSSSVTTSNQQQVDAKTTRKTSFPFVFGKKIKNLISAINPIDKNNDKKQPTPNDTTKQNEQYDTKLSVPSETNTKNPVQQDDELLTGNDLSNIRQDVEKKLKELEIQNGSDYLLIQDLRNKILKSSSNNTTLYK